MLAELCELSPDVQLGQLLAHLGFLGEDQTGRTLWDIDDEQLLAVLQHHRAELTAGCNFRQASQERKRLEFFTETVTTPSPAPRLRP